MKKAAGILLVMLIAGLAAAFYLSRPRPLPPSAIREHTPDVTNGKLLFTVGGCISCHKPPDESSADKSLPSGGRPLPTPVGTVYPPNITPDVATGIGGWSDADFVNAMQLGLAPDGRHLIPAFPYASYTHMRVEDVLDIKAYLMSLPAVVLPAASAGHSPDLAGAARYRAVAVPRPRPQRDRGRSAIKTKPGTGATIWSGAPGTAANATPRATSSWSCSRTAGSRARPCIEGKGKSPSLRDLIGRKRYKDAADLVTAFQWGEAFGYDKMSSGGMGSVQGNLSQLPQSDLEAIAAYLTSLK